MDRTVMEFDIIIVGGGPAGLSAAIRLAQLSQKENCSLNICVLEKGAEIGSHILSGAVLDPSALNELIPDWQKKQAPLDTRVNDDHFIFLTEKKAIHLPTPAPMKNHGNYIISLGKLCRWLAAQAEALGINIFPGFVATELIYAENRICGVITGDMGRDVVGKPTARFQPGIELHAKQTFFAEGCRGYLTQQLIKKFNLCQDVDPQTYAIGIKEIWEIPKTYHQPGRVIHTVGWPLDSATYGGAFAYHFDDNLLAIGLVIGLDYQNPYLNPYKEFQRYKTHPFIYPLLKEGKRIAYGARALNEGGLQSIPKLTFPGGLLIGCGAGFVNVPRIKGIHNAMYSGMIAADSVFADLTKAAPIEHTRYATNLKKSRVWKELYAVRNIRPAMRWGLLPGLAYAALDTYLFRGHAPWTLHHKQPDHMQLKLAATCNEIIYPKADNHVTFDVLSSVFLANIHYAENQPYHLKLGNKKITIEINLKQYAAPETRYCPAGVYETLYTTDNQPRLQINGGNCIHCKACDIKDPTQNITWTPSEGGSGPQYEIM